MTNRGYWTVLTHNGESARRFSTSFAAGRWANKTFGPGNWTLQYTLRRV